MKIMTFYNPLYFGHTRNMSKPPCANRQISFGADTLTINYYDKIGSKTRGDVLFEQTKEQMERFLGNLPVNPDSKKRGIEDISILDAGCGRGICSKYFIEKGYDVDALDASYEMCKRASNYTGINVEHKEFSTFSPDKKYDGIYARNSLLHVPRDEFKDAIDSMTVLLKPNGILWGTIKAGNGEQRDNKNRLFNYYCIDEASKILSLAKNTSIVNIQQYGQEGDSSVIEFILRKDA